MPGLEAQKRGSNMINLPHTSTRLHFETKRGITDTQHWTVNNLNKGNHILIMMYGEPSAGLKLPAKIETQ